jgi:hypothetical protein
MIVCFLKKTCFSVEREITLMDRDEISNLYRGPSIDAAYQVSEEKIKM